MSTLDDRVRHLVDLYSKAERAILRHIYALDALPDSTDKVKRLLKVKELEDKTQIELARLNKLSKAWAEDSLAATYKAGVNDARKEIEDAKGTVFAGFGDFHVESLALMEGQTLSRFADVITTAGRRTTDVYSEAKLQVHMFEALAGTEALSNSARRLRSEMQEKGITGFVDVAGRNWGINTYTDMLARTTLMNARREAKCNELRLRGHDLVAVSNHGSDCPKCSKWENAVLSISGESKKYPSMDDAKAQGMFHPNCKHTVGLWLDLEEEDEPKAKTVPDETSGEGELPAAEEHEESSVPDPVFNAKTLKEAAAQSVEHSIAKEADFTGLDISVANEMNKTIFETFKTIPELRGRLDFVGSARPMINRLYEAEVKNRADKLLAKYPHLSREEAIVTAKSFVKKIRLREGDYAFTTKAQGAIGIAFNEKRFSKKGITDVQLWLQNAVVDRDSPVGCGTIKSIVDHEIGHQFDYITQARDDDEIGGWYNTLMKTDAMKSSVSGYAKTSIGEFIAECWSEYQNNPQPRMVASNVAKKLLSLKRGG